jgi:uncharacterized protein
VVRADAVAIVGHLLAIYIVVGMPLLGRRGYRDTERRLRAGDARARVRLYRRIVLKQAIIALTICALWLVGGIPRTRLGLGAPHSWPLTVGLAIAIAGLFVWSAMRVRPRAREFREKLRGRGGDVLPQSLADLRWFAAVSIGSGVAEELACRGFLFYYLAVVIPRIETLELMLLTSLIFGLAHVYQGWRGVVTTGVAGLVMALLYVTTGSLILPMVAHAMGNLRAALIFWPPRTRAAVGSVPGEGV